MANKDGTMPTAYKAPRVSRAPAAVVRSVAQAVADSDEAVVAVTADSSAKKVRVKGARALLHAQHLAENERLKAEWHAGAPLMLLQLMVDFKPYGEVTIVDRRLDDEDYDHPLRDKQSHPKYKPAEDGLARREDIGVKFTVNSRVRTGHLELALNLDSEEWRFEGVRTVMAEEQAARDAAAVKLKVAQEAWDELTPAKRDALGLKYRPSH